MTPALLLVDLQHDFLQAAFDESVAALVDAAARLLTECRARNIPVVHVRMTLHEGEDSRMAHWIARDDRRCIAGSRGHAGPDTLAPIDGETVIDKTVFSPFVECDLAEVLRAAGVDTVWLAGVHLHACVRATALDAYQRGFEVAIADDAVGSDDPLHAAVTRRYLADRGVRFDTAGGLLAGRSSDAPDRSGNTVAEACAAARSVANAWSAEPIAERAALLMRFAVQLRGASEGLAHDIAVEIAKPISMARAEVERAARLLDAAASRATERLERRTASGSLQRRAPLGVVAAITPWNNPIAIPVGKLAPTLLYGNALVWKPSPRTPIVSRALLDVWRALDAPPGLISMIAGGSDAARELAASGDVDAVTFTGGPRGGWALQELCARRAIPLQAELGGNNAAIVLADADLEFTAREIVLGAFGFAGQRCTANRRVIVTRDVRDAFLEELSAAAAALPCGDPLRSDTVVGPLISTHKCAEVIAAVARCRTLWRGPMLDLAAYHPPTIVAADDPASEIVQRETFAPLLVVQPADDFEHALALANGVSQGLAAALFGGSSRQRARFLEGARAGILKLDRSTVGADAEAPFGGWGHSGIGPAEHGDSNREFYTRAQAIYDGAPEA